MHATAAFQRQKKYLKHADRWLLAPHTEACVSSLLALFVIWFCCFLVAGWLALFHAPVGPALSHIAADPEHWLGQLGGDGVPGQTQWVQYVLVQVSLQW